MNGFQENYGNFIFNNGDKYKGKFSKGLYHGRGILEYNDGNVYDGEWNNGVKEGYGKLIFKTA